MIKKENKTNICVFAPHLKQEAPPRPRGELCGLLGPLCLPSRGGPRPGSLPLPWFTADAPC